MFKKIFMLFKIGRKLSQSGAISSALKSGNYAAALSSLVDKSGKNVAVGALSSAIQSIDNGDITGAFTLAFAFP